MTEDDYPYHTCQLLLELISRQRLNDFSMHKVWLQYHSMTLKVVHKLFAAQKIIVLFQAKEMMVKIVRVPIYVKTDKCLGDVRCNKIDVIKS